MELNKEELIELGFIETVTGYAYENKKFDIIIENKVYFAVNSDSIVNAKTIQDIKDLIRLFK